MANKQKMMLGGFDYELSVRDGTTGFYGAFFCDVCREGFVKYDPVFPTLGGAMQDARSRATAHHAEMHSEQVS
ncbi:MAG TPA: hypothetical protein VGJ04_12665 [Pirellulales bacterium]|jgi:hypothetical protein